jgi:hypothetical protein
MDGSEKMPLLVIGKLETPRCFKHVESLPCTYRHNSSAWMTCALFMEFLTCLERRMAAKNQKILLFVDQCVAHFEDTSELRNVRVEFLPANTTSVLQPMDKGIIRSLKYKYHKRLVCKFLQRITTTRECYKVSLFDAISMLAASWNAVSWETIANCYWKARFFATPEPHIEDDDDSEVSPHIWKDVKEKMNVTFTSEEYVDADDNLLPCAVQEMMISVLKTRIQKLIMRKMRQQHVNQFLSVVKQCSVWIHISTSLVHS